MFFTSDFLEYLEQPRQYRQESHSDRELLLVYFKEYLESITHDGLRRVEREGGLDKAKSSFGFQQYVLERHDIGLDEFLRLNLSDEDYAYYIECGKPHSY